MTATRLLQALALALSVGALVAGAALVGADTSERAAERAEELLERLYDAGPAAVAERIVPGAIEGVDPQQVEDALAQIASPPLEVREVETVTAHGTTLVRLVTDRIEWCVTPDGMLVPACRVGTGRLEGEVEDAPLTVAFGELNVFPGRALVLIMVEVEGDEAVELGADVELVGEGDARFELADVSYVAVGQRVPAPTDPIVAQPDAGLLLTFEAAGDRDLDAVTGGPFVLRWDGGTAELEVVEVRWFVGDDAVE